LYWGIPRRLLQRRFCLENKPCRLVVRRTFKGARLAGGFGVCPTTTVRSGPMWVRSGSSAQSKAWGTSPIGPFCFARPTFLKLGRRTVSFMLTPADYDEDRPLTRTAMATPLLTRSPTCLRCLRRSLGSGGVGNLPATAIAVSRTQVRGKKGGRPRDHGVVVRLLEDIPAFGRKGRPPQGRRGRIDESTNASVPSSRCGRPH